MKTWIRRSLIGFTFIAVVLAGISACGHRDHGDGHGHGCAWNDDRVADMRGHAVKRISSNLALTTEQQAKLAALADEMVGTSKSMRGSVDPRVELNAAIAGPKFDRSKAQNMLDQKLQTAQSSGPKLVAAFADFYDSLSPEQQQKVRDRTASGSRGWWGRG